MDNELFELCKAVYALCPDWDDKKLGGFMKDVYPGENPMGIFETKEVLESKYMKYICPVYNSDYLLEKLPPTIGRYGTKQYLRMAKSDEGFSFCYMNYLDLVPELECNADTPLKAILKLTIALHKANELPIESEE